MIKFILIIVPICSIKEMNNWNQIWKFIRIYFLNINYSFDNYFSSSLIYNIYIEEENNIIRNLISHQTQHGWVLFIEFIILLFKNLIMISLKKWIWIFLIQFLFFFFCENFEKKKKINKKWIINQIIVLLLKKIKNKFY